MCYKLLLVIVKGEWKVSQISLLKKLILPLKRMGAGGGKTLICGMAISSSELGNPAFNPGI